MIPHIIHYFWFGGAPKPKEVNKCIDSWKKFCPHFEIREWNEDNYDIHKHHFMEKAYQDKKWAFVSDYARLDILHQYGGIYLDTDVEVIKDITPLCKNEGYMGFESAEVVGDGAGFGFAKGMPVLKEMMACYDELDEYIESPKLRTNVLVAHGLKLDGSRQTVADIEIYPVDYFCPKNYNTGILKITENTYSIHHFDGSWKEGKTAKLYLALMRGLNRTFGEKNGHEMFMSLMEQKNKIKDFIQKK